MDSFSQKTAQIKQLAEDPEALSSHISNHLHDLHDSLPTISQGLGNTITNAAQFLNSKIPQAKINLPLSSKFKPSETQKDTFDRYFDAVSNPVDVLKEIKSGTLTSEHMDALSAVHPELLQDMRKKIIATADPEKAKKLPYHIQKGLSMFLGTPLHESMLPAVALSNQAVFTANQQQKNQQQGSGKTTEKGLSELGVAKRAATTTQRDEEDDK